jgi:hypothetical protein
LDGGKAVKTAGRYQVSVEQYDKVSVFRYGRPWRNGMMEDWNDGVLVYQYSSFPIFHFPIVVTPET